MAIRVVLADDHAVVRIGLCVLLNQTSGITVVAEARNGEEALASILDLQPDVAVLDCQLPGLSGSEVAQEIQKRGLPVRVLALSAYNYDHFLEEMWSAGAWGYLLKEEAPEMIVQAVQQVAEGKALWTAEQSRRVQCRKEVQARWESLTEREREILTLMVAMKSNTEIADLLCIAVRTVEFHISNILQKLGVGSRVEAIVWVRDHGFIARGNPQDKNCGFPQ